MSNERAIGDKRLRPESLMMSYGYEPKLSEGAIKSPIFQTSTFVFESAEQGKAFFELAYGLRAAEPNEKLGLIYSRLNNPDLEILEDRLTLWDEAESAAVFQSGMAAISTTTFALCRPGDIILTSSPVYGGTDYLFQHVLPEFGVVVGQWNAGEGEDAMEAGLADARARGGERLRLLYVETPANPTNALVDIAGVRGFADRHAQGDARPLVAVDNTFLGPVFQHPLRLGADLVLYSATKFIGGHSDVVAGACLGSEAVMKPIRAYRTFFGTMADAWTGWLLMRSLETLKLRMTSAMKNARYVADFLAEHPKVEAVRYLGHLDPESEAWSVYRRQCASPGSLIAFELHGGEAEAFRFLNRLELIKLAVSLGGTESLAEHPASMTHADIPPEDRARQGITPGMVRLSIGIEHFEDQIADIQQALEGV